MSFQTSLYILNDNPNGSLPDVSVTNIFSHSVAYLLILLMLSFSKADILNLMKSSLSVFSFMNYAFVVIPKVHYHTQSHLGFLLCYNLEVL